MVYFSCVLTERSSAWSSPIRWKPPMPFRVIVAVAAFAVAGSNAQGANLSPQTAPGVVAGPYFTNVMRIIPPNTRRRVASTRAVAAAVERTRLPWPAQSVQASANKRKWMQINESKTAFVCFYLFFRIGTFRWFTADSNK
jgi:hypothetical protein